MQNPTQVFYDFISSINGHDIEQIIKQISEEHQFIDSHGSILSGIDNITSAWRTYFELFPDYKIEILTCVCDNNIVVATAYASGTYLGRFTDKNNFWKLPAAFKAQIENNKIILWQVYADTKIPFDIITGSV